MQFDSVQCNWQVLDSSHKILLGVCLIVFGALGLILNLWLLLTFMKSTLLISRHYLFILAYCIACLARAILAGFPVSSITAFCNRWILGDTACHFFAFFQLVLGTFQVCSLTALAFERYLNVKLYMKGTELCFKFYISGLILCWVLSVLVAISPLLGFGRYYCDMTDTVCDIDWRMVYSKNVPFNAILITFFGIIPLVLSILFLCLAVSKERKVLMDKHYTTQAIIIMITFTYLFWTPKALLILFTVFSLNIPKALLVLSSISSEASTIIPVLSYLIYETTLRKALIMTLFKTIFRRPVKKRRSCSPVRGYRWSSVH